ncbi:MAG: tetratricopeptide repeat protein [Rubrivivax sp.]|nr:tetratricopeptide repeat protein [Rubrivivax sp.]
MAHPDARGNPCSSTSAAARDAAEQALHKLMSFTEPPLADLEAAMQADPGWLLPPVMKAGFLLSLTEPGLRPEAQALLTQARILSQAATAREKTHLEATQAVLDGRWHAACSAWNGLLVDHPRDALALQWTQLWDFYRGDAHGLRQRPARALPEWDEGDPLFPHVLALYAFGLEENNLHAQAEEAGRRALALNPQVPWAVHAVAHVMEMQGRFEDGAAWLRLQQPHWAEGNGLACHLWWHKSLFRLEALDLAGALRLVDTHLSGELLQITLNRIDAVSLLWRLHLLGEDTASRFAALLQAWPLPNEHAGDYAFNDLHVLLALAGAGELPRAEAWLARCAARALQPAEAVRSNHAVAREIGLPLMRGVLALARGDNVAACDLIAAVRGPAQRLGGSHAQRDLIDQTLLYAAARGGRRRRGRALLNERTMAKPRPPLTRDWMERLSPVSEARA